MRDYNDIDTVLNYVVLRCGYYAHKCSTILSLRVRLFPFLMSAIKADGRLLYVNK